MNDPIDECRLQYLCFLKKHVTRYLKKLELIFGPRDPKFVFGTIRRTTTQRGDIPQTHFPEGFHMNGNCRVDIHISSNPWGSCNQPQEGLRQVAQAQGLWQVAHECVHLLDPDPCANVLEEGLATWFQNKPVHHDDQRVKCYIDTGANVVPPAYACAEKDVRSMLPDLLDAVKSIRARGVRISEIKVSALAHELPEAKMDTLERLCQQFQANLPSVPAGTKP